MNKHSFFTTIPAIALAAIASFSAASLYAQETTYNGSITAKAGMSLANSNKHETRCSWHPIFKRDVRIRRQ